MQSLTEIMRHELMVAVRTQRAIWVAAIYLGSAILAGVALVLSLRLVEQEVLARLVAQGVNADEAAGAISLMSEPAFQKLAGFFAGVEPDLLAEPFRRSLIVPFFFWGSLTFLPFLILLTSFDQVAADLQSRSICYTAVRASRPSILFGKLLAQTVLFVTLTIAGSLAWLLMATGLLESFTLADAVPGLVRMTALLLPFGLCYLGLSAFCSTLVRQPFAALLLAMAIAVALRVLGWLRHIPEDHPAAWARVFQHLSPASHHEGLWLGGFSGPLQSVVAYLGFAAVFLLGAHFVLGRRDL